MSVVDSLARLRRQDAGREAPVSIEAAVLAAYRARQTRPRRWQWWIGAAAAAIVTAVALWVLAPRPTGPVPAARSKAGVANAAKVVASVSSRQPSVALRTSVAFKPRHRQKSRRASPRNGHRPISEDEFLAVPYAPPLPSDEIEVVRVSAPSGRQADVVTGVDGIVRAVRWVE